MAKTTREQFLDQAEILFAERGFYGVSIAAIADELGLSKQALLHHFGSKEKMYGEVLRRISDRFVVLGDETKCIEDPKEQLKAYLMLLLTATTDHANQSRLLMRELLDNKRRADSAGTWYLKPFLQQLITMVQDVPKWQQTSEMQSLALVYAFLGAINYYGVSEPTLKNIFGSQAILELEQEFPAQFELMINAVLEST